MLVSYVGAACGQGLKRKWIWIFNKVYYFGEVFLFFRLLTVLHVMGLMWRVPMGFVCSGGLASEGVWVIWYCRYTIWQYICTDYSSLWVHGQTLLLHISFKLFNGIIKWISPPDFLTLRLTIISSMYRSFLVGIK